ncbi:MAG: NupC/NupG family nucleoside CNT transporter, partial [Ligilactobacillus sp.]|nr:NupC/NupG family nucleoside CNT transporter [Ligilactobacillus sp.]
MYLAINVLGLVVFLAIGVVFSKARNEINWRGVGTMVIFNLVMAWFLTSFSGGRAIVQG